MSAVAVAVGLAGSLSGGLVIAATTQAETPRATLPAPSTGPAAMPAPSDDAVRTVTGTLKQWLINPNGDVDGMLLDDGTQVSIAPHLSASLTDAVKLLDKVEVKGPVTTRTSGTLSPVTVRAQSVRNAASGRGIVDQPPQPGVAPKAPRDPSALTAMSASGRVTRLLYGPRGDVNGALIDSGAIVRFPPRADVVNAQTLKVGSPLYAMGYGTRNDYGSALEATRLGATAESAKEVFMPPRVGGPRPPAGPNAPLAPPAPPAPLPAPSGGAAPMPLGSPDPATSPR